MRSPHLLIKNLTLVFSLLCFTPRSLALPHKTASPSQGIPVYLKPTSPVPTGHYALEFLNKHKILSTKSTWVNVKTQSGVSGWLPKAQLLTPLHFSSRVSVLAKTPLYSKDDLQQTSQPVITQKEGIANLLEVVGDRCLIQVGAQSYWTDAAYVLPIAKDAGFFLTKRMTILRQTPSNKGAWTTKLTAGQRLKPIEIKGEWLKVGYNNKVGFVSKDDIISRIDVAMRVKTSKGYEEPHPSLLHQKVYAIYVNPLWLGTFDEELPLYQAPSTSNSVITQVSPWSHLLQQNTIEQTWTQSQVKDIGPVWWQSRDIPNTAPTSLEIAHSEIQKLIINPVFNHIQFASAQGENSGLYRSQDGKNWFPLRGFSQRTPVFTVSKDGILFVDDKMSFDNGEHFSTYVHWGALFEALKRQKMVTVQNTKIKNIETLNHTSQQLVLELDVGLKDTVKVYTADRGETWTVLNTTKLR